MCAYGCVWVPLTLFLSMLAYKATNVIFPEQVAAVAGTGLFLLLGVGFPILMMTGKPPSSG
jgi:hypothetical protein